MPRESLLHRIREGVLRRAYGLLWRLRVEGAEHVPADGPVVIAANHLSPADPLALALALPRPALLPADGPGGRALRALAIPGGGDPLDTLGSGGAVALLPERAPSPDGRLYRGTTEVARLALAAGAPVVPAGIAGTREVMPPGARRPRRLGRVTVRFGEPLHLERYAYEAGEPFLLRRLTDAVMFEVMSLSGQAYEDRYSAGPARGMAEQARSGSGSPSGPA